MPSLPFVQILIALGAGALLNLTPCVLPAIPLKVRAILRETGGRLGARVTSAALFTAGSVLFFAVLGLVTALLHLQWGVLFQSRTLLILLSALLFMLAIVNFRWHGLRLPSALASMHGTRFLEPFVSGLICALLSTPCTGPLLGGVLVFALARPTSDIVTIFVAIGVGLASPYALLILRPALLQRLPRAGAWSEVVRQSFSWILLGAAIFFIRSIVPPAWGTPLWIAFGVGMLTWALAVFARSKDAGSHRAVAIISVMAVALVYVGIGPSRAQAIPWQRLRDGDVAMLPALGRPAIVEFTAQWCINCKILEHTVYRADDVVQTIHRQGVMPFQVDLTRPDPALERLLASYGGAGLPFLAVLDRDGHEVRHFSGLFASGNLVDALNTLQTKGNP
ncbi:thioredoxin family protein (plasmid) [Burkholderia thailandensis]|uniref:protein-disulfide reductase DsbD family protein n=1 Tax=Burkholderia thailandensis TaxID=57975 RepID=UPI00192E2871|nr:cytochrome c biogenesis protein CcdA [Burkholderia thailandensis]MBS2132247.1 thioredoxin family protein [Burkholderia thailandensis]QRA15339.1 thioredoxin family protein [Burkholderia thailandensis]